MKTKTSFDGLSPDQTDDLMKSGLNQETIKAAKIEAVRPGDIERLLRKNGFSSCKDIKSLYKIPYLGCNGYCSKMSN